ncbi:partner of xrn-2 protein 1 [Eurytemora carolleeae]|uniref:partner of xrn-2 protein 1 n=1 Tax=Eurytemora carolleeae TaxID=1294199 RepID=UPI000C77571F|nr:partner of xrn-2 protein 1 [Eurytemora carolleeae]|eukprot:XP_023329460.1 partner of xrn-2 protein 1-like [Eurytemora affinis]
MTHNQDWDIDRYKTEHEPKHHWALKREFMERNKDRFPEHSLVCLANTLGNIEFMGCQYPQDTMDLIDELSMGLVQDYRENQKGKLQRTFVSGSVAANKKVNRT